MGKATGLLANHPLTAAPVVFIIIVIIGIVVIVVIVVSVEDVITNIKIIISINSEYENNQT